MINPEEVGWCKIEEFELGSQPFAFGNAVVEMPGELASDLGVEYEEIKRGSCYICHR